MKKSTIILALLLIANLGFAQSKKIINQLGDLQSALVEIKSNAEQAARDVKKNWATSPATVDTAGKTAASKPADTVGKKTAAMQTVTKKDTAQGSNIKQITKGLRQLNGQADKKPATEQITAKTVPAVKPNQKDPLKFKKDSLSLLASIKYQNLVGATDGLISKFQVIIKNPGKINDAYKQSIAKDLQALHDKLQDFQNLYVNGTLLLIKGNGFSGTIIVELVELGVEVYKQVSGIIASNRQQFANDFQNACALTHWDKF